MNTIVRIVTGCKVLLCITAVNAQELSTASYVGAVEGAAQACAEAFPNKAPVYRDSLYRSVKCHMGPAEFAQWHKGLRSAMPHSAQYQQGYVTGKASLASASSVRIEQCRSLELLVCDPKSPPRGAPESQ